MEAHNLSTGFLLSRFLGDSRYNITEFGQSSPKSWKTNSSDTVENLTQIIPQALVQQQLNETVVSERVGEPRLIKVSESAWSIVKSIGKPIGNLFSYLTSSGEQDHNSLSSQEDSKKRSDKIHNHSRFKPRKGKKKRRWKIRYYHEFPRVPPKVHFRRPWRGRPNSYMIQDDEMLPSSSDQDIVRSTVKTIPSYIRNRLRPQPLSKNVMTTQEYNWHKKWANLNYLEYIPPKESEERDDELQYEDYDDPGYFDRSRENCDDYEICHDETVVEINGPNGNKTDLIVKFVPVFPDSTKPLPYYKSVFLEKDKDVSKINEGLDSIALGSELMEEVRNVDPASFQELSETRVQYSSNRPRRRRKPRPVRLRPYSRVHQPSYSPPTYRRRRPRPIIIKHYANRRVGTAVSPGVLAALPLVLISGLAIGFLAPNVFNISLSSITSGSSTSTNSSLGTIDLLNQFNIGGPNVTNNIFNNNTNGASNVNNDNDTITNINMPRYFDSGPQFADTSWLGYVEEVGRSLFAILGTSPGTFPLDLVQSAQQVTFPEIVGSMTNLGRRMACTLESPKACQGLVICEQIQDNNNLYGANLLVRAGEYLVVGASWWDEIDPALETMTNMAYIAAREDCYQEFKDCNETMISECSDIF